MDYNNSPKEVVTTTFERWSPAEFKQDIDFRYLLASKYCKNSIVLDAGCGIGYGDKLLANKSRKVFGIDYSKEAVEYAYRNYKDSKICFLVMDVTALGFKDYVFDKVVAIEVFEHIKKYNSFLVEMKRVLSKGGTFLMSTPNKAFYAKDEKGLRNFYPCHINLVNFKELKSALNRHFTLVKILGMRRKKGNLIYNCFRWVDFLNLRLLLRGEHRKMVKKSLFTVDSKSISGSPQSLKEEIELKRMHYWNAHTFQGFFVICKV